MKKFKICYLALSKVNWTNDLVDPRGTSQTCSRCHGTVPKGLEVRVHRCPHCGLVMDRDVNAARNMLHRRVGRQPSPGA